MRSGACRIAVLGASGRTGHELVVAALGRGIEVQALYRPGSEPRDDAPGFRAIVGQVSDPEAVRCTLAEAQAACCALGPRPPYTDVFCAAATANLIAQMRRLGAGRLVCLTGAMIGPDAEGWSPPVRALAHLFRRRYPAVAEDRARQERLVRESGLDWTLVKPPRIAGGRRRGRVTAAPALRIGLLSSIRREDLADFLLEELVAGHFHRQAVYVIAGAPRPRRAGQPAAALPGVPDVG
jgi:putative NADH-flavin reductase